jgi:REP element-mobilizing transposase RayT
VRQTKGLPIKDATGENQTMNIVSSGSSKKISGDTRNNWVTMMFVTKKRYMCFRKQSHINTCVEGFYKLEQFGFEFRDFGFAGNHVHFQVNIPKRYSVEVAEIMLKSWSSRWMFEKHPGFRKRYSRGSFWSGYEHHVSTGLINLEESSCYLRDQQQHHKMMVVDDAQQKLDLFISPPSVDAA